MPEDQQLVLIFGALHLMALIFGGLLLTMFFRSETLPAWHPPEDEEDGGGGGGGEERRPATPRKPSPGGLPLADAEQARARLREPGRLADHHPFPVRRPEHAPEREREREPA